MDRKIFTPETDGFYGAWYPNPRAQSHRAMILMGWLNRLPSLSRASVGEAWSMMARSSTAHPSNGLV